VKLMSQPGVRLVLASAAWWGLWSGPAFWHGGREGVLTLTFAVVLCVVPGLMVLGAVSRFRGPDRRAWAILFGTGLRLAFVLAGVLVATKFGGWRLRDAWFWIVLVYLFVLLVETLLILKAYPEE
jgi:hypothetical protein